MFLIFSFGGKNSKGETVRDRWSLFSSGQQEVHFSFGQQVEEDLGQSGHDLLQTLEEVRGLENH